MRIDHVLIRARDVEATRAFFTEGIGLTVGPRPDFGFPGYWLYAGDTAVVHLRDAGDIDPPADDTAPAWPFDHVAFIGDDHDALVARLTAVGIDFVERIVPGGEILQVFASGPDGVHVEIQFPVDAATTGAGS